MGYRTTPARVAALIRARYNLQPLDDVRWPTRVDFGTMLNTALRKFYALCVEQYGHLYLEKIQTFTVTPPAYAYQLPVDFVRLVDGPFYSDDNKTYLPLKSAERGFEALIPGVEPGTPVFYLLSQGALTFAPRPDKPLYMRMRYLAIPGNVDPEDDVTMIDGPPDWDDYVAAYVCLQLALSERKDISGWSAAYATAKADLKDNLAPQDDNAISTVQDVLGPWSPDAVPRSDAARYEYYRNGPYWRRMF